MDENGFEICDQCNGSGRLFSGIMYPYCSKCKGTGKITWLENIFGVKDENKNRGTSSTGPR